MTKTINYFRSVIDKWDVLNPKVSAWSVGMHIHHCCLAMNKVCDILVNSQKPPPASKFSLARIIVFTSGRIPRGRGKAPEASIPSANITKEALSTLLDLSIERLKEASNSNPNAWFEHHVFGVLGRDQTLKFLKIHNRHHQRIINSILKKK